MVVTFFGIAGFIAMMYFLHRDFLRRRDKTYRILREAKEELRKLTNGEE